MMLVQAIRAERTRRRRELVALKRAHRQWSTFKSADIPWYGDSIMSDMIDATTVEIKTLNSAVSDTARVKVLDDTSLIRRVDALPVELQTVIAEYLSASCRATKLSGRSVDKIVKTYIADGNFGVIFKKKLLKDSRFTIRDQDLAVLGPDIDNIQHVSIHLADLLDVEEQFDVAKLTRYRFSSLQTVGILWKDDVSADYLRDHKKVRKHLQDLRVWFRCRIVLKEEVWTGGWFKRILTSGDTVNVIHAKCINMYQTMKRNLKLDTYLYDHGWLS